MSRQLHTRTFPHSLSLALAELESLRQKYEALSDENKALLKRIAEFGLMRLEFATPTERYRFLITEWIRDNYGDIKVTPNTLHTLKPDVMRKAMDRLYLVLGRNPKAKDIVHDVFRTPRIAKPPSRFI